MIGKLLGDGTIVKQTGRAPRFSMLHRIEDKPYLESCHQFLSKYIPLSSILYKKSNNPKIKQGYSECYYCYSKKNYITEDLYFLWYPDKHKSLPKAFIENNFTKLSLAIWYQDDGHLKIEQDRARKIVLSTESFSDDEILFLQNLISAKFKINFHMDNQRRLNLYNMKEVFYFLYLVRPFLCAGMGRKDFVFTKTNSTFTKKRTTVSLPTAISSGKPTSYINKILLHTERIQQSINNNNFYRGYYPHLINNNYNYKYQIINGAQTIAIMYEIKHKTGLTYNEIAFLCLLIEQKKIAQGV